MHYRNPYILFKKTLRSGTKIWYYSFYDETGKRRQLSTGQKTKALAQRVCHTLYYAGAMYPNLPNSIPQLIGFQQNAFVQNNFSTQITMPVQSNSAQNLSDKNQYPELKKKIPTFKEYTVNWYDYDKCEYIQKKLLHGFKVTKHYVSRRRRDIEKNLVPFFGKFAIDKIDGELVEKYIKELKTKKNLANATVNISLKTLKVILSEAYKKGDIDTDISQKKKFLKNNSRTRGVFSEKEAEKLLDKNHIADYWRGNKIYYGMNYLASKTGMRLGELQALMKKNVFPDHILVEHGWSEANGLQDTKNHKSRIVPISKETHEFLIELANQNTDGEYIFSMSNGERPATRTDMYRFFAYALEQIGITKKEKTARYLSFHSWRHYVNSKLINSGVPKSIVQSIIGHVNDDAMTEHYTHVTLEEQKGLRGGVRAKS